MRIKEYILKTLNIMWYAAKLYIKSIFAFWGPNNLTTAIDWELVVVKSAHRKQRKRSIGELLFCMLRSAGNK